MDLKFTNRFSRELPADPLTDKRSREVRGACFSRVDPTPTTNPQLVATSIEVATDLGITEEDLSSKEFLQMVTGNLVLEGMDPHAVCYGGHQFGNWAGQLGDGRAIALGEVETPSGEYLTLQLKGAGPTPYSRGADGYAVLRSSVREFLCSEAMFHLGVPTTRALSLAVTGDEIVRDMLYDGNPGLEPGAIVCRVAPSFTRFGNFELFPSRGEIEELRQLLDFTIRTDFPHLGEPSPGTYVAWFQEVSRLTADLMVHWMRVGFVHGVMNTDNLSVLGLTIDYGPYGWLENFDPNWTPNTTDKTHSRYRFGAQPQVAQWNLAQLGNAIYPLINSAEPLEAVLSDYVSHYQEGFREMMAAKFGLADWERAAGADAVAEGSHLDSLIHGLNSVMALAEIDMTIFYRRLADIPTSAMHEPDDILVGRVEDAFYVTEQITARVIMALSIWLRSYLDAAQTIARELGLDDSDRRSSMNKTNPKYVLRNYLAQLAIDKAHDGDYSMIAELHEVFRRPYDEQPEFEHYAVKRPDWARTKVGCSQLSCSS